MRHIQNKSYYYQLGLRRQTARWIRLVTGNLSESALRFKPLYDTDKLEEYLNRDTDLLIGYLISIYRNRDLCMAYFDAGWKDPALNHALSKAGYYKSEFHKEVIDQNWEEIMVNAHYKFMRWALPTYDKSFKLRFCTFYNNRFAECYLKEFLEFIRKRVLDKKQAENELFVSIEELEEEPCYDGLYNPSRALGIEFLRRFIDD